MKIKNIAISLVVLGAIGAGAYFFTQNSDQVLSDLSSEEEIEKIVYTLQESDFRSTITSIGELRASKSSTITSPYSGKVIKIVPEGSRVEVGDPVVWFETEEREQEKKNYEAQLKLDLKDLESAKDAYELEEKRNDLTLQSEKIKVEIARQSYEDAKQKYEAEQVLFDKNISPQTKLDEARLRLLQEELNLRNAQINLAKVEENLEANLRVKNKDIERAELRVEKTEEDLTEAIEEIEESIVRANNPGDIAYLKIWKSGSVAKISEGDQVWRRTNMVEIPDTSEMLSVVPISEIDIGRIELGQKAFVRVEAIPGQIFEAKVHKKSSVPMSDSSEKSWEGANGSSGPREFEVSVMLDGTDELFRQGMTSTAEILVYEKSDCVPIPIDAVVSIEDQDGVYVFNGATTEYTTINITETNESYVLTEPQLSAGTQVLLNPPSPGGGLDVDPDLKLEPVDGIQTSAVLEQTP